MAEGASIHSSPHAWTLQPVPNLSVLYREGARKDFVKASPRRDSFPRLCADSCTPECISDYADRAVGG